MSVSLQIADEKNHCDVSQMAFLEEISHSALSIDYGLLTVSCGQNLAFTSHLSVTQFLRALHVPKLFA